MRDRSFRRSYGPQVTMTISVRFLPDEVKEIDSLKDGWESRADIIRKALALALKVNKNVVSDSRPRRVAR